jgi:prepilin-type N-terminal cleavage/methylation domain-containing protein
MKEKKNRINKKGFTLVEEVVSLLILSILILVASGMLLAAFRIYSGNVKTQQAQAKGQYIYNLLDEKLTYAVGVEVQTTKFDSANKPSTNVYQEIDIANGEISNIFYENGNTITNDSYDIGNNFDVEISLDFTSTPSAAAASDEVISLDDLNLSGADIFSQDIDVSSASAGNGAKSDMTLEEKDVEYDINYGSKDYCDPYYYYVFKDGDTDNLQSIEVKLYNQKIENDWNYAGVPISAHLLKSVGSWDEHYDITAEKNGDEYIGTFSINNISDWDTYGWRKCIKIYNKGYKLKSIIFHYSTEDTYTFEPSVGEDVYLNPNDSKLISVKKNGEDCNFSLESADPSIVSVESDGKTIKAVATGQTSVTITYDGEKTKVYNVVVMGIKFEPASLKISTGNTEEVTFKIFGKMGFNTAYRTYMSDWYAFSCGDVSLVTDTTNEKTYKFKVYAGNVEGNGIYTVYTNGSLQADYNITVIKSVINSEDYEVTLDSGNDDDPNYTKLTGDDSYYLKKNTPISVKKIADETIVKNCTYNITSDSDLIYVDNGTINIKENVCGKATLDVKLDGQTLKTFTIVIPGIKINDNDFQLKQEESKTINISVYGMDKWADDWYDGSSSIEYNGITTGEANATKPDANGDIYNSTITGNAVGKAKIVYNMVDVNGVSHSDSIEVIINAHELKVYINDSEISSSGASFKKDTEATIKILDICHSNKDITSECDFTIKSGGDSVIEFDSTDKNKFTCKANGTAEIKINKNVTSISDSTKEIPTDLGTITIKVSDDEPIAGGSGSGTIDGSGDSSDSTTTETPTNTTSVNLSNFYCSLKVTITDKKGRVIYVREGQVLLLNLRYAYDNSSENMLKNLEDSFKLNGTSMINDSSGTTEISGSCKLDNSDEDNTNDSLYIRIKYLE